MRKLRLREIKINHTIFFLKNQICPDPKSMLFPYHNVTLHHVNHNIKPGQGQMYVFSLCKEKLNKYLPFSFKIFIQKGKIQTFSLLS